MRICVLCDDEAWKSLFVGQAITLLDADQAIDVLPDDVLFDLRDEAWDLKRYQEYSGPVFLAAVVGTRTQHNAPANLIRINAWPGMLTRPAVEAVGDLSIRPAAEAVMLSIGKTVAWVDDLVGMVSPRVITMIINEAGFAWEEGVSQKASIDVAMKLGTNYPLGPFEWGTMIGWHRLKQLQKALANEAGLYQPSQTLTS
ncbi:MAG: 3-hydroxyacyl-CoA dehydrogenase family protein [Chitinophagaceae bacterium]